VPALTYNAENRPATINRGSWTYDALGRPVEPAGASFQIVYAPTGERLAYMQSQTFTQAFVPLPGGATVIYNSSGVSRYRHPDWLGSARVTSTPQRAFISSTAYAPFGEPYATLGPLDPNFTGQESVNGAGLFDFSAREYSNQGRWASPDPAGIAAVDPSNPQSWNRYAYVTNNPVSLIDPSGLGPVGVNCLLDEKGNCHGGGGGSCTIHGFAADCGLASGLLQSGAGVQCPSSDPIACASVRAVSGTGGTTILQQWIPTQTWSTGDSAAGYVIHQTIGYWHSIGNNYSGVSIWDFLTVPWSGTVLFPLVPFGPVASAGAGPTVAYNPRTDTGCYGLAVGAMVPAGGRAAAAGPLTVGNLHNADNILAGGSVFAGAQSPNPAVGVQAMGNSSGLLAGATFGTMGAATGASVSKCQGGVGKKLLNWLIDSIL
jgi:RHS repeat-associated protein